MKINQKQVAAVLALSSDKRYEHFIKLIADWQEIWGLYNDGWALAATESESPVFPMWPAKEYAELCAQKEWAGYIPESFSLDDLLNELLPKLKSDNVLPGIFYTPLDKGITPSIEQLINDINTELANY